MRFPIAPLLFALAALQESLYDYLGYNNAAALCTVSSWIFAGSTITQALEGLLTSVEINIQVLEHKLEPLFETWQYGNRKPLRLSHTSVFTFTEPPTFLTIGTGAEAKPSTDVTFSYDELISPSSAVVPVHVSNAGLSVGATGNYRAPSAWSTPFVYETILVSSVASTPSASVLATPISGPPDKSTFYHPVPTLPCVAAPSDALEMSASEFVPTSPSSNPALTTADSSLATSATTIIASTVSLAAPTSLILTQHQLFIEIVRPEHHLPSKLNRSLTFYLGLFIFLGLSIAIQISFNLYVLRNRVQCSCQAQLEELVQIRLLIEKFEDFPNILDNHNILLGELRAYMDLASREHNTFYKAKMPVSNEAEALTKVHQSVVSSPVALLTNDTRLKMHSPPEPRQTSRKLNDELAPSVSSHISARVAKLSKNIRVHEQRVDQALDELFQVTAQYPRLSPMRLAPTTAPSLTERRKTAWRAEINTSPLAHRVRRKTGTGIPTPDPSRAQSRAELLEAQSSTSLQAHIEDSTSMAFSPAATSSPLTAITRTPYPAIRMPIDSRAITESATTSTTAPLISPSGPSLVTEPLPPQSPEETSLGTQCFRPLALDPDTSRFPPISHSHSPLTGPLLSQTSQKRLSTTPCSSPPAQRPNASKFPSVTQSRPLPPTKPPLQSTEETLSDTPYSRPPILKPDITVEVEGYVAIHKRKWLADRQRQRLTEPQRNRGD
ncbi:hypothetical protein BN14_10112 [Rhizoctonia solani AG-1 IB]|uniref:Uncharacterized protein n=1 Tax=Thanatephorus cucumeris (strain AG1-IB / isolate 7/3/14) TaxID=1108050 RepID=M5CA91_THACB|nr:hypothetical protein BN14_10112 [Rhizoctonia solani AG-1 IB]